MLAFEREIFFEISFFNVTNLLHGCYLMVWRSIDGSRGGSYFSVRRSVFVDFFIVHVSTF